MGCDLLNKSVEKRGERPMLNKILAILALLLYEE